MRKFVAIMVITSLVGIQGAALAQERESPCADPVFQKLQSRPIEELTKEEYRTLREKQRECEESGRLHPNTDMSWDGARDHHRHGHHRGGKALMWMAAGVVVGGAATAGVMMLTDGHHRGHGEFGMMGGQFQGH